MSARVTGVTRTVENMVLNQSVNTITPPPVTYVANMIQPSIPVLRQSLQRSPASLRLPCVSNDDNKITRMSG